MEGTVSAQGNGFAALGTAVRTECLRREMIPAAVGAAASEEMDSRWIIECLEET
jgi:hypothetical protein